MGIKRIGGFIFTYHIADHGNHVHVSDGKKELGRFDIEKQEFMEKDVILKKTSKLADALRRAGYLLE